MQIVSKEELRFVAESSDRYESTYYTIIGEVKVGLQNFPHISTGLITELDASAYRETYGVNPRTLSSIHS